jgi:minor extracellular serine protease Vpr
MPLPASHHLLRTIPRILLTAGMLAAALPGIVAHAAQASDATAARATQDSGYALVVLLGDPLATATRTQPPKGKKIDFSSNSVKAYRAQLAALRNDYKKWLRSNVPQAMVTGEFDLALNAVSVKLNGATLEQVSATSMVAAAQYEGLYYPNQADPDMALISAPGAWANNGGSAANAGAGVKVAIVDSGIDVTNPCFSDAGYPAQAQLGDHRFTNNKVIVARVFSNRTPQRGYTAAPIQEHGTHVAGTVACNFGTPAPVNGVATYDMSGVAPGALLGNYNIFPGDLTNARSEDILNALEAAYEDGFDVANMSLGGGASGIQDLLTIAVDNLDRANMVVAVAAGNSGPGYFTVESPGSAERALTAGAASVGHMIATPITVGGVTAAGVTGDFATVGADLTAPLAAVTVAPVSAATGLSEACSPLTAGSLTGAIALISRGTCSFSTKIRNAQNAGAVAVLVTNNQAGDGIGMATDGTPNQPTVPAYSVSKLDGAALKGNSGASTTIGASPQYIVTVNNDVMAGFSSQGPTDVDFRVKPDVVAPGVNVLSSIPAAYCATPPCFAFFQGTSMATPHLAGSAAVVRQQHSDWSAAQIRSAIVNTADQGVLKSYTTGAPQNVVNITGSGRENLLSAARAAVALDPVSVSFGAVPSGSGQTRQMAVTLTNLGGTDSFSLDVSGASAGVSFSVDSTPLTIEAGQSATVSVTMSADRGASAGPHQAVLRVSKAGAEVAHAALFTLVK